MSVNVQLLDSNLYCNAITVSQQLNDHGYL